MSESSLVTMSYGISDDEQNAEEYSVPNKQNMATQIIELCNEGNTQFKNKAEGDDIVVLVDTTQEFFVKEKIDKRLKSNKLP